MTANGNDHYDIKANNMYKDNYDDWLGRGIHFMVSQAGTMWLDDIYIIPQYRYAEEPTFISSESSELDPVNISDGHWTGFVEHEGLMNGSYFFPTATTRSYSGLNVTVLKVLEGLNFQPSAFEKLEFNYEVLLDQLQSTHQLEFFLYGDLTDYTDVITNDSITWNINQQQTFWNTSSIPLYSQTFNSTEINASNGVFDLRLLGDYWLSNRDTNTVFGFGMQLLNLLPTQNETSTSAIIFDESWDFDITLKGNFSDNAYNSLSTQLEQVEQFQFSVDFQFITSDNASWSTNENQWQFQFSIQTFSGGNLYPTHYIRSSIGGDGSVYLQWRTVEGTLVSYDTGITLDDQRSYKFNFDISKSNSKFDFAVINSTGDQVLRPITWQSLVSSDVTERPSYFPAEFLEDDFFTNNTGTYRRGVYFTLNATSTYVYTGDSEIAVDRLFSTSGLLDQKWRCAFVAGYQEEGHCSAGSQTNWLFDDAQPYSVHYSQTNNGSQSSTFDNVVRDFRSLSGLLSINNEVNINESLSIVYVNIIARPIYKNGTRGTWMEASIWYIWIPASSGHWLRGKFEDNTTIDFNFGTHKTDGSQAPKQFDVGFGLYWTEEPGVLAFTAKYFDQDNDNIGSATTFGKYDPEEITDDIEFVMDYWIDDETGQEDFDTGFAGTMGITDVSLLRGATLKKGVPPQIPAPQFNYIPPPSPGLWDQIVGLGGSIVGGAFGLGGGILNFVGGLPGNLLNGIGDLWTIFWQLVDYVISLQWIEDIFDLLLTDLIPAIIGAILWIWDAILTLVLPADWKAFIDSIFAGDNLSNVIGEFISLLNWLFTLVIFFYFVYTFYIWSYPIVKEGLHNAGKNFFEIWFSSKLEVGIGFKIPIPNLFIWLVWTLLTPFAREFMFSFIQVPF
jgi:hypothetical protein